MHGEGISWSDIGNAIEQHSDGDKYSTAEMKEFAQAARAEGVEAGIKIGRACAQNGHLVLPSPSEMAEHCRQHIRGLKDSERDFVNNLYPRNLSLGRLGFLASIYIKTGGATK